MTTAAADVKTEAKTETPAPGSTEGKPAADAGKAAGSETTKEGAKPGSLLGDASAPKKPGEPEKKEEGKPDAKTQDGKKTQGAPENYTDFTVPEGLTLDAGQIDKFKAIAKDLNLSQEQAQKLVALQAEGILAENKTRSDWWNNKVGEWRKESLAALGPKHQEELAFAAKALDRFGDAKGELRKYLTETGIGEHPLMVAAWVKIGKEVAEDKHVEGGGGGQDDSVEATKRALFPSMYKS